MSAEQLRQEDAAHKGTGGASAGCKSRGFQPAFLDFATLTIYVSRFADGRPAPVHLVEGLPGEVIAKATLISGFERDGFFYTRRAAARACENWGT